MVDPNFPNLERFPLLRFSGINAAFDILRHESKGTESVDIRQVFQNSTA